MQAKDQLRPTWSPSAGSPHRKCTPSAYGTSPRESVSHDSQSPAAPYESCSLATGGSMSLDFRVTAFPYKSSSFATPEGRFALRFPLESCSTLLSTHSAPCIGGKVVAPATKGGAAFPSPVRAVVKVLLISKTNIPLIGHLRWPFPLWCLTAPPFPRCAGAQ